MAEAIRGAGLFDLPFPSTPRRRARAERGRPELGPRLIPGDAEGQLALAEAAARRRHPSARRSPRPVAVADDDGGAEPSSSDGPPAPRD